MTFGTLMVSFVSFFVLAVWFDSAHATNITWNDFLRKIASTNSSSSNSASLYPGFQVIASAKWNSNESNETQISTILGTNHTVSFLSGKGDNGSPQITFFIGNNVSEAEFRSNFQLDPTKFCGAYVHQFMRELWTPELVLRPCDTLSSVYFRFLFPLWWNFSASPPTLNTFNKDYFENWIQSNGEDFSFVGPGSGSSLSRSRKHHGKVLARQRMTENATETTLVRLLQSFSSQMPALIPFRMDPRIQFSLQDSDSSYFLESMSTSGVSVNFSEGSRDAWLNLNCGTDYTDLRIESFNYARVVEKGGFWTPWIEIEGPIPTQMVSLKLLFPLFFDYTMRPPSRNLENIKFFHNWVSLHGRSFFLSPEK
jgi:hypothetical protein